MALIWPAVSWSRPQIPSSDTPVPLFEYLGAWGTPGDGPGQLREPAGLATDRIGNVYVADHASGYITKFDTEGHPLLSFQISGKPTAIGVDLGGAIYVTTTDPAALSVFMPDGKFFRQLRGGPRGRFAKPVAIALDDDGNAFVLDSSANRVDKYNARLRWSKAWGKKGRGAGEFSQPESLALGPDSYLYVLDRGNDRIQRFTRNGEFVSIWGSSDVSTLVADGVVDLTFSSKDAILSDATSKMIQIRSLDGHLQYSEELAEWLQVSSSSSPLWAVISQRRMLFILDPSGPRVLRFHIDF